MLGFSLNINRTLAEFPKRYEERTEQLKQNQSAADEITSCFTPYYLSDPVTQSNFSYEFESPYFALEHDQYAAATAMGITATNSQQQVGEFYYKPIIYCWPMASDIQSIADSVAALGRVDVVLIEAGSATGEPNYCPVEIQEALVTMIDHGAVVVVPSGWFYENIQNIIPANCGANNTRIADNLIISGAVINGTVVDQTTTGSDVLHYDFSTPVEHDEGTWTPSPSAAAAKFTQIINQLIQYYYQVIADAGADVDDAPLQAGDIKEVLFNTSISNNGTKIYTEASFDAMYELAWNRL